MSGSAASPAVAPGSLGRPFSVWSLPKLRDYLAETGVVAARSVETPRKILHAGGVSWQATKTWKTSTDPDFVDKMHRILALYDRPPLDGRVICADEFGPLNLQPRPGRGWFGTDHRSHTEQDHALGGYIRWRNQKAMPKRHFAVNSKIRRQDYLPNVA